MSISLDRIELTDQEASLLKQASHLMSKALDRPHAARFALVEEADGTDVSRLEMPPETLRLLSQVLAFMARRETFALYPVSSELTTKQAAEVARRFAALSHPGLGKRSHSEVRLP
jgi:hypothetical protein